MAKDFITGLNSPVRYLKGAGPKISKLLEKVGVKTVEDLLYFLPRDYEDRSRLVPIISVNVNDDVIVAGQVLQTRVQRTKRGFNIFKAVIQDKSGKIVAVWFNQPFLNKIIKKGRQLYVSGKIVHNRFTEQLELNVKSYDLNDNLPPEKIIPVYPLTEGLYQKKIRKLTKVALQKYHDAIIEYLPESIIKTYRLISLKKALQILHFPQDLSKIARARQRIVFDDLFMFQLGLALRHSCFKKRSRGHKLKLKGALLTRFKKALPFDLTNAQKKVFTSIGLDLESGYPMNRLLQGDVGSGKTIVALLACVVCCQNEYQAVMMAPTEILARQHYNKVKIMFEKFGVKVGLLTGSLKLKEKQALYKKITAKEVDLVIGTHALLEKTVKFNRLGLVVIDEQQRFGVRQRSRLTDKGNVPHVLVMTATPIPRTLALTLYGDLDKSVIDELPPGRTPVQTFYVPEAKRRSSYDFIRQEIVAGRQAYVVCPLVAESEKIDLKAAREEALYLANDVYKEFKVGLIHGKMKTPEKNKIMRQFINNEIQLLVSTTVIEVGIDVPNAAIMLIEHVERFGLSALHQLRGRIGRGAARSYCFLCGNPKTNEARARVKAMLATNDGFKIAEADLKLRGPGDVYGLRQSGLPEFRLADIITDEKVIILTRKIAFNLIKDDPGLLKSGHASLKKEVMKRYKKFLSLGALN